MNREDIDEIVVGLLAIRGHIKIIRKSLATLHNETEALKSERAGLSGGDNHEVIETLWDLKNQVREIRDLLSPYAGGSTAEGFGAQLTREEMKALLYSSPEVVKEEPTPAGLAEEVARLKRELEMFQEQAAAEMEMLRKSIETLSEVCERHEADLANIME